MGQLAWGLLPVAAGFLPTAVGMTYLASVTDWLAAWGPVAWGAIGIASGGAVLFLIAFSGRLRARRAEPALNARVATLESGLARVAGELQRR